MSKHSPPTVLVVDDDVEHARTLVRLLKREGYAPTAVHNVTDALDVLRQNDVDVVLTDLVMPGKTGLDLLKVTQVLDLHAEFILMTAFGTVERAVEAMKAGARDFIVKPIKRATLIRAIHNAVDRRRLTRENIALREQLQQLRHDNPLVGTSPVFRDAIQLALQAARSEATILIFGESGTGKENVARAVHQASRRNERAFVAIHCAALPGGIIESELFGHEHGAFTGAHKRKTGLIEAADTGTLFLDEIGEIPLDVQVKLLRVLQEGELMRVGSTKTVPVDVRVIAATHRNLEAMVADGTFREDLYYRINVIPVRLPPLRERTGDVPLLVSHLLARTAAAAGRTPPSIDASAMLRLEQHAWPGNVRELQNVVQRAIALDTTGVVTSEDLGELGDSLAPRLVMPVGTSMAEIERVAIETTLRFAGGDKNLAASILGVGRRTIYRKLEEYARSGSAGSSSNE